MYAPAICHPFQLSIHPSEVSCWNNGKYLASMNGGVHSQTCPKNPGKKHACSSRVAVTEPIWQLNERGERVEQLTEEGYAERWPRTR